MSAAVDLSLNRKLPPATLLTAILAFPDINSVCLKASASNKDYGKSELHIFKDAMGVARESTMLFCRQHLHKMQTLEHNLTVWLKKATGQLSDYFEFAFVCCLSLSLSLSLSLCFHAQEQARECNACAVEPVAWKASAVADIDAWTLP